MKKRTFLSSIIAAAVASFTGVTLASPTKPKPATNTPRLQKGIVFTLPAKPGFKWFYYETFGQLRMESLPGWLTEYKAVMDAGGILIEVFTTPHDADDIRFGKVFPDKSILLAGLTSEIVANPLPWLESNIDYHQGFSAYLPTQESDPKRWVTSSLVKWRRLKDAPRHNVSNVDNFAEHVDHWHRLIPQG